MGFFPLWVIKRGIPLTPSGVPALGGTGLPGRELRGVPLLEPLSDKFNLSFFALLLSLMSPPDRAPPSTSLPDTAPPTRVLFLDA